MSKRSANRKKSEVTPTPKAAATVAPVRRPVGRPRGSFHKTDHSAQELKLLERRQLQYQQRKAQLVAEAAVHTEETPAAPVVVDPVVSKAVAAAVAAISTPAPADKELSGPVIVNGELYFSERDRLLYNNRELGFESAVQAVELQKMRILQFKQEAEKRLMAAATELKKLESAAQDKMQSLHQLQGVLEDVYAVSFEKMSYDLNTGKILVDGKAVVRNS